MFTRGISPATRRSLAVLAKYPPIRQFYLAGGTACALHLGHRLSFDLDFFTQSDFTPKELVSWMKNNGKFNLDQIKKDTLLGTFLNTKVSYFKYDYPSLDKMQVFDGIKIASIKDLMAMKIDAISSRGTKRDFVDLYFLLKKYGLLQAFKAYQQKYKGHDINLLHSIRAMMYFIDAEKDKPLKILVKSDWKEIKKYYLNNIPKVLDQLISQS